MKEEADDGGRKDGCAQKPTPWVDTPNDLVDRPPRQRNDHDHIKEDAGRVGEMDQATNEGCDQEDTEAPIRELGDGNPARLPVTEGPLEAGPDPADPRSGPRVAAHRKWLFVPWWSLIRWVSHPVGASLRSVATSQVL